MSGADTIEVRVAAIDWPRVEAELDDGGAACLPRLLTAPECRALAALYAKGGEAAQQLFRSRVVMARHGYGRGEYRYFSYPLPAAIGALRSAVYPHLVPIANRWSGALGNTVRYPQQHAAFIERCHGAGQTRPTPLLLQYGVDDYNCLHQDLYGAHAFPLQLVILLSEPGRDFEGGEFVLTEQRPRMQSRPSVLPLHQGDGALIAVDQRPVHGARGVYRVRMRHGVSRVRAGQRHAAGVIFHDAH